MRKGKCGNEVDYDGYEKIEFEGGFLVIKGNAKCSECGKKYEYQDLYDMDFSNPDDVILEEVI